MYYMWLWVIKHVFGGDLHPPPFVLLMIKKRFGCVRGRRGMCVEHGEMGEIIIVIVIVTVHGAWSASTRSTPRCTVKERNGQTGGYYNSHVALPDVGGGGIERCRVRF